MMWNETKSVRLSRVCVVLFMVLLAAMCVGLPFLTHWLGGVRLMTGRTVGEVQAPLLAACYVCAAFAAAALWDLRALLRRVAAGAVFEEGSVAILRRLSWYCIGAGLGMLAGAVFAWPPLALVAAAAAFMGLILRVLKNVFGEAVRLKNENDYTI